jgi:hypothetical protein
MSKLYLSEQGRVIPTLCEELTDFRRARKILDLPITNFPARMYLLARSYPNNPFPLRITVNGQELPALQPKGDQYLWYMVLVPPEILAEKTIFEFWNDAPAMNAWSIGIEHGQNNPGSFLSTDGGKTWQNERMGHLHVAAGEYIVRVRLEEGSDPPPPPFTQEDLTHLRLERIRSSLPLSVHQSRTSLEKARALASWVCTLWEYRHAGAAAQYAPWDMDTIMAWGASKKGHDNRAPVVMCVHYGIAMVTACQAAGLQARTAVFTGDINSPFGHFASEVWLPEFNKWVFVDPNLDAVFFDRDIPLSVTEIQQLGNNLQNYVRWGEGHLYQMKNPVIREWVSNVFLPGLWHTHRSTWSRADFLSKPECSPPAHGAAAYSETDLIWEEKDLHQGLGMFPYFASPAYFEAPPAVLSPA